MFVCGISLTSGQLVSELFPDCTRSCFSQVVLQLQLKADLNLENCIDRVRNSEMVKKQNELSD